MKKFLTGILGLTLLAALPVMARADMMNYQSRLHKARVFYQISGISTKPTSVFETITSTASNFSFAFNNNSGIVKNGMMSFGGMSIGFGGTALSPTQNMVLGNLQVGGVISVDPGVTYNVATNTYAGTGHVIEFVGTGGLFGMLRKGWNGQYGTPGAGPGGGWMPAFGNSSSIMPGWGGSTANWGMMGGYGTAPTANGTGFTGGGGMMYGNGTGGWSNMGPGSMGPGMGGMVMMGLTTLPRGTGVGMLRLFIVPTTAAEILVSNGTPNFSSPIPARLKIMLPAIGLRTQ